MARKPWLFLLPAVLALKVALALVLAPHPLLQPVGDLDSGEYWRLAQRVVGGDLLLEATPFYVSPLYIYVLALLQVVGGGTLTGVLLGQAALGTAAAALVGWTTARWSTPLAATIAVVLVSLTGVVALQEAVILQSALDALLVAALLASLTLALQEGGFRRWLLCGAALALFALNRPNAWVLTPLCVAAAARLGSGLVSDAFGVRSRDDSVAESAIPRRRRERRRDGVPPARHHGHVRESRGPRYHALLGLVAGLALVVAPFTLRTALATGAFQVLPGHGGLNLYLGNHAGATGTYTVVEGIRPSIEGQRDDTRRVAERAAGRPLSDAEVSAHFVHGALDWWREAPGAAVRLTIYKAWLALHAWELPVNVSYAWFRAETWLLALLPVGAWLLLPLAVVATIAGAVGIDDRQRQAWRFMRWALPTYLAGLALVFVVDRYRAPALVMAAVSTAPLLAMAWTRPGALLEEVGRWRLGAATLAGVAVFGAGLVPLPFHLGEGDADLGMALHAIASGQDEAADRWLARAAARHQEPGVVWFRAGLAWQAENNWARSEAALRDAYSRNPDVGEVAFALAGSLLSQGKGTAAVRLLRQAEAAGVRTDRVRLDLALALWQAGDEAAARSLLMGDLPAASLPLLRARALAAVDVRQLRLAEWQLEAYLLRVPGDAEVTEKLGLMRAAQQQWTSAAEAFEAAAKLDPRRATARFNLALVRLQQGRREDARALLREALRIDPQYAQAAGALREIR